MTLTDLYRDADFTADKDTALVPSDVADAVMYALNAPENVDIYKLMLKPVKHRIIKK